MHRYWASIFILPKKVLDKVTAICRNFLWDGKPVASRPPPIAWDLVCKPKKEGGIGIKDCFCWNIAALGKYIWKLAQKEDSLWVKWVDHIYMKGKNWREMAPKQNSSWYWKQLCKVKERLALGFSGDNWRDGSSYTVAKGYDWLRQEAPRVNWDCWVWNRLNIPKHSFISWLIMRRRIQTKDRLAKHGLGFDLLCPLCQMDSESIDHLYFDCPYSRRYCKELGDIIKDHSFYSSLSITDSWLRKGKTCYKKKVIQALVVALLYNIWRQRNLAIWEGRTSSPNVLNSALKNQVFARVSGLNSKKASVNYRSWIQRL